jgi:glycosyltransferase involved in cell wall biosynthesis
MRLVVQIPCFNEEKTLPETVRDIPREIPGITSIEVLVIDDGSVDGTPDVARRAGVQHVVRLRRHRGLAAAFQAGIDAALRLGADIIVNTDADNQYVGADIATLVAPVLSGEADIVIGCRDIESIPHFSFVKKRLQRLGSRFVRRFSGAEVPDATSGFRAYSREAAARLVVSSPYTYTLETIIRSGRSGQAIVCRPIRTNAPTRPSRLIKNIPFYIRQSVQTIFSISFLHRPLRVLGATAAVFVLAGLVPSVRFLYFLWTGDGMGHIQSLILAAILLLAGVQIYALGLAAYLSSLNRKTLEDILYRIRLGDPPRR